MRLRFLLFWFGFIGFTINAYAQLDSLTVVHLQRVPLEQFEGIWEGKAESGETLHLELSFEKIYYGKGNFLVDQLVGFGSLRSQGSTNHPRVIEIKGVELVTLNAGVLLNFQSIDMGKNKPVEAVIALDSLQSTTGIMTVRNKETWVINGKVDGKDWDSGFSIPTNWILRKVE